MSTEFQYDPERGAAALAAFRTVTAGPWTVQADAFEQGLMAALQAAEWSAVNAGVVPGVVVAGTSSPVLDNVGAAPLAPKFAGAPDTIRIPYLAMQNLVRRASSRALPASAGSQVRDLGPSLAANFARARAVPAVLPIPVVIGITIVGVAVVAFTAWYAVRSKEVSVQVDGQNLRLIALTDEAIKLVDAGKPVPDDMWRTILGAVQDGAANWTVLGLAGVAAAAVLVWFGYARQFPKKLNPRRRAPRRAYA